MTATAVLVIVGMGAVTYLTRVSGLWLGDRVKPHPRVDAVLAALPGAILVSLIAPDVVHAGIPGVIAAAATVLAALRWRGNIVLPMMLGVVVVWALRMV